jgi:hypothetical protein
MAQDSGARLLQHSIQIWVLTETESNAEKDGSTF